MNIADDTRAIEQLIRSQFDAVRWDTGGDGQWNAFQAGFMAHAQLYAAARPAKPQTVPEFVARMRKLAADGTLRTFSERSLGVRIMIFGNVAVALAGCEMLENGADVTRDVSAYLLVKDASDRLATDPSAWRIAAQAWDAESANNFLPRELADPSFALSTAGE